MDILFVFINSMSSIFNIYYDGQNKRKVTYWEDIIKLKHYISIRPQN